MANMSKTQPAFDGMLRNLIDGGILELQTDRSMPPLSGDSSNSGRAHRALNAEIGRLERKHSNRVWCRSCQFKPVYTYGLPFSEKEHNSCQVSTIYGLMRTEWLID